VVFGPTGAKWNVLGGDLRAFYTAGTLVRTGREDLLYDVAAQN
jgi:hypothetical protein